MKLCWLAFIFFVSLLTGTSADENPFIAAGIPASDRAWIGKDYADAFEAIHKGKSALPMLEDPQGNRVFLRLINEENFGLHKNKTLPVTQRLGDFLQLQQGFNSILKAYLAEANKGKKLHAEMAAGTAFTLHIAALGVELANEFLATIPKDETYQIRVDGMRKANGGLIISFSAVETSLGETKFYSPDDIALILQAMHTTLPTLLSAFTPDYKLELTKKLTERKTQFTGKDLSALEDMIKILGSKPANPDRPASPPKS